MPPTNPAELTRAQAAAGRLWDLQLEAADRLETETDDRAELIAQEQELAKAARLCETLASDIYDGWQELYGGRSCNTLTELKYTHPFDTCECSAEYQAGVGGHPCDSCIAFDDSSIPF
jgi:hypothetical protein